MSDNDVRRENLNKEAFHKLREATILKNYAINSNLELTDELLFRFGGYEHSVFNDDITPTILGDLDIVIRDLTEITFPATAETISRGLDNTKPRKFLKSLIWMSICALIITVISYNVKTEYAPSITAIFLGLLGAIVNVFFHAIGVMSERVFGENADERHLEFPVDDSYDSRF